MEPGVRGGRAVQLVRRIYGAAGVGDALARRGMGTLLRAQGPAREMSRFAGRAALRRVPRVERTDGAYVDQMEDADAHARPRRRNSAASAPGSAMAAPQL